MFLVVNATLVFSALNERHVVDSRGDCTMIAAKRPSFAVDQGARSGFSVAVLYRKPDRRRQQLCIFPRPRPLRLRGSTNEEASSSSNGPGSYQGFDPKSSQQQGQSSEIAHKVGRYPVAVHKKPHERRTRPSPVEQHDGSGSCRIH